jgi:nucleoside-diphosphate-sugar epimerase
MKLLFIGGTGLISSACVDLALERGHEVFVVNRASSKKYSIPSGAVLIQADIHADEDSLAAKLKGHRFDAVIDFLAYTTADVQRGISLFRDRADQFVFISSASAYQKPPKHYLITEQTPLENPFWAYSRDKIACEELLMKTFREDGFPATIVRPSLTYGPSQIPILGASWLHPYTVVDRVRRGAKLITPGDGTSLWVLTWNADFAVGLLGLLGNQKAIGESFHITSDEVLTWNQIFKELYLALGVEANNIHVPSDLIVAYNPAVLGSLIGDKVNSVVFDNSKIKRFVPEFQCRVTWSEGVRRSLAWFEADPARRTIDEEMNRNWDRVIDAYQKAQPS